jgi:hypothetical protein
MFGDWDAVRRSLWNPMVTIDQSTMRHSSFHNRMLSIDDDEFFKDLPVLLREQTPKRLSTDKDGGKGGNSTRQKNNRHAFSTYSISNFAVVDDKGRQVTSMRRRYEDSSDRLKAVHKRQIAGKKLRTTWNRRHKDDKGRLESVCSSGTPDEFEAMWLETPFGRAKEQGEENPTELKAGNEEQELPRSKL